MAAIELIKETNRAEIPGPGLLNNVAVRAGDINKVITRLNSLSTTDGSISITGDLTVAGTTTLNGNVIIGSSAADTLIINATVVGFSGTSSLVFEGGTTDDAFETTINVTNPAADRVYTIPDNGIDGNFVLSANTGLTTISSSRNNAQALLIEATAGGIDILASGAATEDIDILNTGGSVNISSTENVEDSIKIESTAGGINIFASGAGAGEDIDITATGSSVNITATENATDSIKIESTTGGIDILASGSGGGGEDIDVIATGGSVNITATETVLDAIVINASGGGSGIDILTGNNGGGNGGPLDITLGNATAGANAGGSFVLTGGTGSTTGAGGSITLTAGTGGATGTGGELIFRSGASAGAGGTVGNVTLDTGAVAGGAVGNINIGTSNSGQINFGRTGVNIVFAGTPDLNGVKLILDADADTSITADTDDTIDIELAGADDFQFTANTFTALSGSVIATNTINETTATSGVTIDSVLLKDGGATLSVAGNALSAKNTTDGASVQVAILEGDRATVADGDEAYVSLKLSDSAGNQDEGARITWKATTVADGATQDCDLILSAVNNGSLNTMITLDGSADNIALSKGISAAGVTSPDLGTVTTVDINGGTIDGTVIGGAATAAATFTTCDATTDFTVGSLVITSNTLTATGRLTTAMTTPTVGTGFDGAAFALWASKGRIGAAGPVISEFIFDLTNLVNSTTAADIIGETATANCHMGQITAAVQGTAQIIEMVCLETPAGGDPDIDLYSATESTGTENALVTDLTETLLLARGASWANGDVRGATVMPAANEYLYLAVGSAGGAPGTYTAGKFKITIYGTV